MARSKRLKIFSEKIATAQGSVTEEQGVFDATAAISSTYAENTTPLNTYQRKEYSLSRFADKSLDTEASLSKKLPVGAEVGVALSSEFLDNNTDHIDPATLSTVSFNVTMPLLREFGTEVTEAELNARQEEVLATKLSYARDVGEAISVSLDAYWNYCRAIEINTIHQKEVTLARQELQKTQSLVDRNQKPESDLYILRANLSSKQALQLQAQDEEDRAYEQLKNVVGYPYLVTFSVPPTGCLATPPNSSPDFQGELQTAYETRADLKSLEKTADAASIREVSAELLRLPQLDAIASVGYSGLDEDDTYVNSLYDNIDGLNWSVGGTFSYPLNNNAREGDYIQAKAARRTALLEFHELQRQIEINLKKTLQTKDASYGVLKANQAAVKQFEFSAAAERKRYAVGMATILDVIQTQNQLLLSRIEEVSARKNVLSAILEVQKTLGIVYPKEDDSFSLRFGVLVEAKR
jgi:outer membrane protein